MRATAFTITLIIGISLVLGWWSLELLAMSLGALRQPRDDRQEAQLGKLLCALQPASGD